MLDVSDSLDQLAWTTEHHYRHIAAQHDFMRAWAVQFELAYTDFRTIQLALQLAQDQHDLLVRFTGVYDTVYQYEYEFAANGLAAFNAKYGDQLEPYRLAAEHLSQIIGEIRAIK